MAEEDIIVELARRGPVTAQDLTALGLPRARLQRLHERGELVRVGRGVYRAPDADRTELTSLADVAKRAPAVVFCLLTALQIHGLTTEVPHEVWVLLDNRARAPRFAYPRLHVVRASGAAATHGVVHRTIEGVDARITSPAKTVADCFRYRGHVGLDVALSALRDFRSRSRRPTPRSDRAGDPRAYTVDALVAAARADRVESVMRPYLEAIV
jgi:predicted transcriptional regulator of viral defense system